MTTLEENIEEEMEEGEGASLLQESDSSAGEIDERNIEEIHRLEQEIEKDPFNYDSHIKLISLLLKGDDLDKLRSARESMASLFPLTPQLWLEWIQSEANLCLDNEEKSKVIDLFQRATKDYTSVELWLEYGQFTIGLMATQGGVEKVRTVFEEACSKVGLHVTKGAFIFEAYREFELALYSTMVASGKTDAEDPKHADDLVKQKQRIQTLYKRQLSIPLLGMEKALEELREFGDGQVDETIMMLYNKALKRLEMILPFEEKLMNIREPKTVDYEPYLDFELKQGDGARIQTLFERAILDDCLNSGLWEKYLKYLDLTLKIDSLALPVHERSVRNCPWASSLWVSYLTCLEKMKVEPARIQSVVNDAFQAGFSTGADYLAVWMFHICSLRRQIDMKQPQEDLVSKLRNCFEKAREHLAQFSNEDVASTILQYWAKVEAKLGNLPQARELWNLATRKGSASDAQTWLNNANFERTFGDEKHYRKVLQRGMFAVTDWPETLGELWVQFELEEGSLEGLLEAQTKFDARMKIINEKRHKLAMKDTDRIAQTDNKGPGHKTTSPASQKEKKRRAQKGDSPTESKKKGKWQNLDNDGFKKPQPLEDSVRKDADMCEVKEHGVGPSDQDPLKDMQTVFLSNLAYEVNEESILELFKTVGEIEQLRLVRDYKKRCKGFGYLVFKRIDSVTEALKKDRSLIDGRPVFVSRLNERKQFSYAIKLERNKLFVKNIPFDATKEELESLFGECGSVRDVRMCILRNGKFKGMAYVDYELETDASSAVIQFDGYQLRNKTISVAISNPPVRQHFQEKASPKGSTMKTRLFVPRVVKVNRTETTTKQDSSIVNVRQQLRSNADFRALLHKQ